MGVKFPALAFAVFMSLALSGPGAIASTPLDETYWEADDNCFIVDIFLYANGDADIEYDNDETDTGKWTLSGKRLRIQFDSYEDFFSATVDGHTIKATHRWDEEKAGPQSESCTFTFVDTSI